MLEACSKPWYMCSASFPATPNPIPVLATSFVNSSERWTNPLRVLDIKVNWTTGSASASPIPESTPLVPAIAVLNLLPDSAALRILSSTPSKNSAWIPICSKAPAIPLTATPVRPIALLIFFSFWYLSSEPFKISNWTWYSDSKLANIASSSIESSWIAFLAINWAFKTFNLSTSILTCWLICFTSLPLNSATPLKSSDSFSAIDFNFPNDLVASCVGLAKPLFHSPTIFFTDSAIPLNPSSRSVTKDFASER